MAKKNFTGGINSLLGEAEEGKDKAPPEPQKRQEIVKTTQEGTYEGEERATFIVKVEKLKTLKVLAYWERKKIKDLLDEALTNYFNNIDPALLETAKTEFEKTKK